MAIAASTRMRRLLLLGRCFVDDIKVIRVVENETGGSIKNLLSRFQTLLPISFYFCPSERFSAAANFCGSILCFIEPFLTIDMPPVSSDTTTTTASVISLRPIAAR